MSLLAAVHRPPPPIRVIYNVGPLPWGINDGDVYEFVSDMSTRAGHVHRKGSFLYVLRPTFETPHQEVGESGFNWVCLTDHGISIWATLAQCISRGLFKKVDINVDF